MKNPLETIAKLGLRVAAIGTVATLGMNADQEISSTLSSVFNPRPAHAETLSLTPTERVAILKAVPIDQYIRFEHAASLLKPYDVSLVLVPVDIETPKPNWSPDQRRQHEEKMTSALISRGLMTGGKLDDPNTIAVVVSTKTGQQVYFKYGEGLNRLFDQSLPWERGRIYPASVGLKEGLYAGNTKRLGNDTVGEFAERIHVHAMAYSNLLPQNPRLQDQDTKEIIFGKAPVQQDTSSKVERTKEYELEIEFLTEPELNPHEEALEHLGYRAFTFRTSRIPEGEIDDGEHTNEWIKWSAHVKAELILSGAMAVDEEGNTSIPEGTIVLVVDKEGKRVVTIDDGVATDLDEIFKKYSGIIISVDDYFTRTLQNPGDTTERIAQFWSEIKGNLILHKQEPKAQKAQAETAAPEAPKQEEPVVLPQPIKQPVSESPQTPQQKAVEQPITQNTQEELSVKDISMLETLWDNMPDWSKAAMIMGFVLTGGAITFSKRAETKKVGIERASFDIPPGPTPSRIMRFLKRIEEQGKSMEDWIKAWQITHPEEWDAVKATLAGIGVVDLSKQGGSAALFKMRSTLNLRIKEVKKLAKMIQEQGAPLPQFLLPKAQLIPVVVPVAVFDARGIAATQESMSSGTREFFPEPAENLPEEKPVRKVRRTKRGVSVPEIPSIQEDVKPNIPTTMEETVETKEQAPEMSAEDTKGLKAQLEKLMRSTYARIRRFGLDPSRSVENTKEKTTAWAADITSILDTGKYARELFKKGDWRGVQKAVEEMHAVHKVLNEESKAYQSKKSMDTLVELDMKQHTWKYAVGFSQKEDYLKKQGIVFEANGHATNGVFHVEDTSAITRTRITDEDIDSLGRKMEPLLNHTATTPLQTIGRKKDELLKDASFVMAKSTYTDELMRAHEMIADAKKIEEAMAKLTEYKSLLESIPQQVRENIALIKNPKALAVFLAKQADTADAIKQAVPLYKKLFTDAYNRSERLQARVILLELALEAAVKRTYIVSQASSYTEHIELFNTMKDLIQEAVTLDREVGRLASGNTLFKNNVRLPALNRINGKNNGHVNGAEDLAKKEELVLA